MENFNYAVVDKIYEDAIAKRISEHSEYDYKLKMESCYNIDCPKNKGKNCIDFEHEGVYCDDWQAPTYMPKHPKPKKHPKLKVGNVVLTNRWGETRIGRVTKIRKDNMVVVSRATNRILMNPASIRGQFIITGMPVVGLYYPSEIIQ